MQGKVSMVVPCYNKADYIGAMLESVIAQVWDNIELILVNDGSTDGTREVISEYEPKLQTRGYELVIIDQENAGCCAAVYAGLLRMTGDYFCLVDCDDEIMPEYVSRMAGWLDEHCDYEVAACNFIPFGGTAEHQEQRPPEVPEHYPDEPNWLENFLLCKTITATWIYMTRRPYADRMKASFCTERRKTYEPLIANPLAFGGGKIKFFNEGLYKFNQYANGMVVFDTFEKIVTYYEDYYYLHKWTLERLELDKYYADKLDILARTGCLTKMMTYAEHLQNKEEALRLISDKILTMFADKFLLSSRISNEDIILKRKYILDFVEGFVLDKLSSIPFHYKRVVGYGALGRAAATRLPLLEGTDWQPDELWDIAGDGGVVKKPIFNSLGPEDVVLVFPKDPGIILEIRAEIKKTGASVLSNSDIHSLIVQSLFPQVVGLRLGRNPS